jgi:hypothetical protein
MLHWNGQMEKLTAMVLVSTENLIHHLLVEHKLTHILSLVLHTLLLGDKNSHPTTEKHFTMNMSES